jgi:hypothetical protein
MPGTWVTDMRQFLTSPGEAPSEFPPIANYLGRIVSATSLLDPDDVHTLDLPCRRRPANRSCTGLIHSRVDSSSGEIDWHCPVCDDRGHITGWRGSPWDLAPSATPPSDTPQSSPPPDFSPKARAAWERITPEIRLRVLNNVWCTECKRGSSMALNSAILSGPDLVLRGHCTKCNQEVARVVEEAGRP